MKKSLEIVPLFLALFVPGTLLADPITIPQITPQTLKPSQTVQKKVSENFNLYADLQEGIRNKKLRKKQREGGNEHVGGEKIIYLDQNGRIRDYSTSWGSDDSVAEFEYIYDTKGRLRLILTHAGYVGMERSEDQKIFLDEKGGILEVVYEAEYREWDGATSDFKLGPKKKEKKILNEPLEVHDLKVDLKLDAKKDYETSFDM
jgi:hypothetical protein